VLISAALLRLGLPIRHEPQGTFSWVSSSVYCAIGQWSLVRRAVSGILSRHAAAV